MALREALEVHNGDTGIGFGFRNPRLSSNKLTNLFLGSILAFGAEQITRMQMPVEYGRCLGLAESMNYVSGERATNLCLLLVIRGLRQALRAEDWSLIPIFSRKCHRGSESLHIIIL